MSEKFLHREKYIKIGGGLMLASPFFNFALTVFMSKNVLQRYGMHGLSMVAQNISIVNWALYASSVVIGLMMLKGRRASWAFVLVVLGIYIMRNSITFSHDTRNGYLQPVLAMIINITIFVLVYIQEFHQQVYGFPEEKLRSPDVNTPVPMVAPLKPAAPSASGYSLKPVPPPVSNYSLKPPSEPSPSFSLKERKPEIRVGPKLIQAETMPLPVQEKPAPAATPAFSLKSLTSLLPEMPKKPSPAPGTSVSFKLPMWVDFQGLGAWAQLISISESEVLMHGISSAFPEGIETKAVELRLPAGNSHFKIQARLTKRTGNEYVFSILNGRFQKAG